MGRRQESLRVYLVEDSDILRKLLQGLLAAIDAEIVGYSDEAARAIREIPSLEIDVVVVDIALREGSGFDVLQAALRSASGKRPRRIILSNHSTPAYRDAAGRLGVDGFFDKSKDITKMIEFLAVL